MRPNPSVRGSLPRIVLARPVILLARNLIGSERRARHVLRRGDPGEHGKTGEAALRHGLSEEDPGRFVSDAHFDARLFPLALQNLLDQFARAAAGRRHDLEAQFLTGHVVTDAVLDFAPP